jgi:hypothetical protein
MTPGHRRTLQEGCQRLAELLSAAARLGVPVLAGTDVTGTIPQEVVLLSQMGLEPEQALAAASAWPRRFLRTGGAGDILTYYHDPHLLPRSAARPWPAGAPRSRRGRRNEAAMTAGRRSR